MDKQVSDGWVNPSITLQHLWDEPGRPKGALPRRTPEGSCVKDLYSDLPIVSSLNNVFLADESLVSLPRNWLDFSGGLALSRSGGARAGFEQTPVSPGLVRREADVHSWHPSRGWERRDPHHGSGEHGLQALPLEIAPLGAGGSRVCVSRVPREGLANIINILVTYINYHAFFKTQKFPGFSVSF